MTAVGKMPQPLERDNPTPAEKPAPTPISIAIPNTIPTAVPDKEAARSRARSTSRSARIGLAQQITYPGSQPALQQQQHSNVTLWKLFLIELNIPGLLDREDPNKANGNADSTNDVEYVNSLQLLMNYIRIPVQLERFMIFGLLNGVIIFLKVLTITPLRVFINLYFILRSLFIIKIDHDKSSSKRKKANTILQSILYLKNDLITISLILCCLLVLRNLDSSKIYHNIRVGTAVKLYFMVGALEVADKLLSAIGQDIIRILCDINFITSFKEKIVFDYKRFAITLAMFAVTVVYLAIHSHVFVYQIMALNVAVNSYSNALLTLIISNQFAELKGSVFKKSEREGLFQISCADLNERFQLFLMLFIIFSRNLFQMYGYGSNSTGFQNNIKPNSWYNQLILTNFLNDWFGFIIGPMFIVIGSEVIVDWIKHSYITRFNRIKPTIYRKYTKVLAIDYINNFKNDLSLSMDDNKDLLVGSLIKRTGLPLLSSAIVFIKMTIWPWINLFINGNNGSPSNIIYSLMGLLLIIIICLFGIFARMVLSLVLLKWSNDIVKVGGIYKTSRSQPSSSHHSHAHQAQVKPEHQPPLSDYMKGDPNVSLTELNESERHLLYDEGEEISPSLQDLRISKVLRKTNNLDSEDKLIDVQRFEMADKRIW